MEFFPASQWAMLRTVLMGKGLYRVKLADTLIGRSYQLYPFLTKRNKWRTISVCIWITCLKSLVFDFQFLIMFLHKVALSLSYSPNTKLLDISVKQLEKGSLANTGPPFTVWGRRCAQNNQKLIFFATLPQITVRRIIKQDVKPAKNFQFYDDNLH